MYTYTVAVTCHTNDLVFFFLAVRMDMSANEMVAISSAAQEDS